MVHSWAVWGVPSIADQLQFSMLARLQGATNQCIYMRVYEASNDTLGDDSRMIIVLNFADVEAKIRTNRDAEFVMALDDKLRWGFRNETIGGPDSLEKLVEMLKSVSTPTEIYRIYTNGQQAVISRELIIEPEGKQQPDKGKTAKLTDAPWNICHRTGQPHRFDDISPEIPIIGRPYAHNAHRVCHDCHLLIYTGKLTGE